MATENDNNMTDRRRNLRLRIEFDEFFYMGLYQMGPVQPLREFSQDRNRPGRQVRDEVTGLLVWKIKVSDPAVENADRASYAVHLLSEEEPVPTTQEISPHMRPIELVGVTAQPRLKGSGEFKYQSYLIRASGYAPAPGGRSTGSGPATGKNPA
ncbi:MULTISPECIES: hypothetical protein [Nocardia]|uniref:hypothetical protein n=1 Tax=Nocardia TaxID=1817 RepID=UPI0018E551C2|nr:MULTISPECIES: hypothetical protein [Nocardia]